MFKEIHTVKVTVTKIVAEHQPTIVEFHFTDIHGKKHVFHDKIAVVSPFYHIAEDDLPKEGKLRCTISEKCENSYIIDTDIPDCVDSLEGNTVFEVAKNLII